MEHANYVLICTPLAENQDLFNEIRRLETEQRNPDTMHIDMAGAREIAGLMNAEDRKVAGCVEKRLDRIAEAIEMVRDALGRNGRLIYAGAGTSGRLGVLDAVECPPTFGTGPQQVQGLIAGGRPAMFEAQEGAEDRPEGGAEDIAGLDAGSGDVVCGLAASGRTPYVLGALQEARRRGCGTVFICCVQGGKLEDAPGVDVLIDIPVGPEVIMGSTRLKSATAQKMVCNMITTGAMVRLGKICENVMVDLQQTNRKLAERSRRIVMMFTEVDYQTAGELLQRAGGHVKTALVMQLAGVDRQAAERLLAENGGFIRAAVQTSRE